MRPLRTIRPPVRSRQYRRLRLARRQEPRRHQHRHRLPRPVPIRTRRHLAQQPHQLQPRHQLQCRYLCRCRCLYPRRRPAQHQRRRRIRLPAQRQRQPPCPALHLLLHPRQFQFHRLARRLHWAPATRMVGFAGVTPCPLFPRARMVRPRHQTVPVPVSAPPTT